MGDWYPTAVSIADPESAGATDDASRTFEDPLTWRSLATGQSNGINGKAGESRVGRNDCIGS